MTIFPIVREILCDRLVVSPNDVTLKSDVRDDLGADSLDMVEIEMDIEARFGILVGEEDGESFTTVSSIVQFIERQL